MDCRYCVKNIDEYRVLDKIGEGSFSEVLKCQDRHTGTLYAAKRLKKIYQNVNEILESPEIMAMRKITRHPNVLYMVESHYDVLPGRVTLIFELMEMSLYDLMRSRKGRLIVEFRVKHYVYQILRGLEYLHKHGIFHRDIKPENILVKGSAVKIGDLGSVRASSGRPPYTEYISTRWYRSPECLLTGGFYGPKMDVWAAGCVFFELLTLEPLFPGDNEVDQIAKIHNVLGTPHARLIAKFRRIRTRNSEFYFPAREARGLSCLLPQLSQAGLEALCLMLVYDPENRAAARQLLEHRYFADTRERELPRQTRSTSSSSAQLHSGNVDQRGNPFVLSYLSSERHRKFRLLNACHSQLRYVDASKIARIVESTPDARSSVPDAESRRPEPARIDDLRQTLVGRYFLRKRQSLQSNRLNTQQKKWYDSTVKFANQRYCDKKPYQRENIPTKTSVARPQQLSRQSFFLNDNRNNMQTNQEEKRFTSASKLPSIYLKRNRSSVCYVNSPMHISDEKSFQVNIATIHEHQSQGQPARKTSISKSPQQKIAKREISNDYHLRTTTFNSSKLSLRKSSQQRF